MRSLRPRNRDRGIQSWAAGAKTRLLDARTLRSLTKDECNHERVHTQRGITKKRAKIMQGEDCSKGSGRELCEEKGRGGNRQCAAVSLIITNPITARYPAASGNPISSTVESRRTRLPQTDLAVFEAVLWSKEGYSHGQRERRHLNLSSTLAFLAHRHRILKQRWMSLPPPGEVSTCTSCMKKSY